MLELSTLYFELPDQCELTGRRIISFEHIRGTVNDMFFKYFTDILTQHPFLGLFYYILCVRMIVVMSKILKNAQTPYDKYKKLLDPFKHYCIDMVTINKIYILLLKSVQRGSLRVKIDPGLRRPR